MNTQLTYATCNSIITKMSVKETEGDEATVAMLEDIMRDAMAGFEPSAQVVEIIDYYAKKYKLKS